MALYLRLSGSATSIKTPSVSVNKIVMEMSIDTAQVSSSYFYYLDARPTNASYMYGHKTRADEAWGGSISNISVDGTSYSTYAGVSAIPRDKRTLVEVNFSAAITAPILFFRKNDNTYSTTANVYRVSGYNGASLVFDYDMTKGNVNDQSGNGKNGTLAGGTWLDDGTGGTQTGTDGTTTFDVKQSIYSDSSLNADTKLSLYSDSLTVTDTKQSLYQDGSLAVDSKQFPYAESQTTFDTKQVWYTEGSFQSDLLQILKEPAKPIISEIHLMGGLNTVTRLTVTNDAPITIQTKNTTSIHWRGGIQ